MKFEKYQHIERLGTPATDGILDGICYVFPKLDGTNTSVYLNDDEQKQVARRVYDKAWKILKVREKDDTANKRPTVHETLAKVGLTDDDLIHAILDVHQRKFDKEHAKRQAEFDNQHIYLENELRRILK